MHTVERIPELAEIARKNCASFSNVHLHNADGRQGWPAHAPYDAILVTAAPEQIPSPLIKQLKTDGNLVIPIGPSCGLQNLLLVHKKSDESLAVRYTLPVRFVPLISSFAC